MAFFENLTVKRGRRASLVPWCPPLPPASGGPLSSGVAPACDLGLPPAGNPTA